MLLINRHVITEEDNMPEETGLGGIFKGHTWAAWGGDAAACGEVTAGPCSLIPCLSQHYAAAGSCCALGVSLTGFHSTKWTCGPSEFPLPLLSQACACTLLRCSHFNPEGPNPKTVPHLMGLKLTSKYAVLCIPRLFLPSSSSTSSDRDFLKIIISKVSQPKVTHHQLLIWAQM